MRLLLKRLPLVVLLLALGSLPGLGAAPPRSVGQLFAVEGRVEVVPKGGKPAPARSYLRVVDGDVLKLAAGARACCVCWSGSRWNLSGPSAVRCEGAKLRALSGNPPVERPRFEVSPPLMEGITSRAGAIVRRQDGAGVGPSNPRPFGAVTEAPCVLRWDGPAAGSPAGGAEYKMRVRIKQENGTLLRTVDLPATAREFAVPEELSAPGKWHLWSVTLLGPVEAMGSCAGAYRVLSTAEAAHLERLGKGAAALRQRDPKDPVPDLLLAWTCDQLGLWAQAVEAYERALRTTKDEATRQALARVRANLGAP